MAEQQHLEKVQRLTAEGMQIKTKQNKTKKLLRLASRHV